MHAHPLFLFKDREARCDGDHVLGASGSCSLYRGDADKNSYQEFYMCEKCNFRICHSCFVRALSHQLKQISKTIDMADEVFPGKEERKTNGGASSRNTEGHYAQNFQKQGLNNSKIPAKQPHVVPIAGLEQPKSCCCCPVRSEERRRRHRRDQDRDCVIF